MAAAAVLGAVVLFGAGLTTWMSGTFAAARAPGAAATPSPAATPGMMPGSNRMACCGMMAGGMMSGGMMNRSVQAIPAEQASALGSETPAGATVDAVRNELHFATTTVSLTVLASPDDGPDMTFRIAGLTNPRVIVPTGAAITVQLINADADTPHGWLLSAAQPPFGTMAMMDAPEAFAGSFAMPVPRATAAGMPAETITFTASQEGQFSYLCPVMGHAAQGMVGAFVVTG